MIKVIYRVSCDAPGCTGWTEGRSEVAVGEPVPRCDLPDDWTQIARWIFCDRHDRVLLDARTPNQDPKPIDIKGVKI